MEINMGPSIYCFTNGICDVGFSQDELKCTFLFLSVEITITFLIYFLKGFCCR